MSQRRYVIDSAEFAREGRSLAGALEPGELARLRDVLADTRAEVRFSVAGETARDGKLYLKLEVDARLRLRCQRCLENLELPLRAASRLQLVEAGQPWPEDDPADENLDAIPAEGMLDLAQLVEDEILLRLPLAPRHERCAMPGGAAASERAGPFDKLRGLIAARDSDPKLTDRS
jgi:uncharacterized protein